MSTPHPEEPPLRILLIEDDEDDYIITHDLLETVMGASLHLDWIPKPEEALAVALERRHDVILVDYRLGSWSGLDLIRQIIEQGCPTPSILLTGEGRDNLDIEALQSGAADYLAKSEINPLLLKRSIRYAIERKRSEEKLRESEERFRTLANAVPALIWMAAPNHQCIFVNQSWLAFRGTTLEHELQSSWEAGVHPEDAPALLQTIGEAFAERKPFETELRMRRADGEYRWMLNTGTPIYLQDGTFNGFVGTCIDIMERKVASENLAQARDEAVDHARLKSQFLANMTHEIRTPMNGILGMAGLLQQTDLNQEQRELTDSVRSSGQSLLRIIDDILDFSRLEARRLTIDRAPFNLLSVVEDAVDLLAEAAKPKGIELISSVDPNIPLGMLGDSGRLRQVLVNLIGNAIKFTHEGEVLVALTLLHEDSERSTVRIDIRDTGIGMSPETQEKLFTAFMQADGSTTRKYGGTGLGLAISKELVELMEGRISVESKEGTGSTFRLVVPLDKDPDDQTFLGRGQPGWKGRKILVIDDNPEQRAVLCRQFTYLGFDCVELGHGSKAARVLEEEVRQGSSFAAVFLAADGALNEAREQVSSLANSPGRGETRIVAMPFGFLNEKLEPLRAAGADDFLSKPIRQSQLHTLLPRLFSHRPAPVADESASDRVASLLKKLRFLIVSDVDEVAIPLQGILQDLGSSADRAATGSKVLQALKLFRYDAVFLDHGMAGDSPATIRRQIGELPTSDGFSEVPVLHIGPPSSQPDASVCLKKGFQKADITAALRQCGLLPHQEANRPRSAPEATSPKETPLVLAETEETLDMERLDEIRRLEMGGEDVLTDLLDLFRQEVPHRVEELQRAVKENQKESIQTLSHAISGICSNLGAKRLEAYCAQLKMRVAAGDTAEASSVADAMRREVAEVDAALEKASESASRSG